MKQFIYLLAFAFMSVNGTAQTTAASKSNKSIENLTVVTEAGNVSVTWTSTLPAENYWEVQGSEDGKSFKTIGLVLGTNPTAQDQYAFKQAKGKLQPGLKYFRVAQMQSNNTGLASDAIAVSK
ncbi:MAG: hypothetical protein EOO03_07110 [Chitinophagaceae bacterium]|nr:MAG: hypothetical protein EOO03_07110 [Chitinophagaceae bacterium]